MTYLIACSRLRMANAVLGYLTLNERPMANDAAFPLRDLAETSGVEPFFQGRSTSESLP